ncbi:hypothetical protein KB151_003885 [[Clostridium] innocuum]|nr:hypothetical protein [[Clostridium] innocuum]
MTIEEMREFLLDKTNYTEDELLRFDFDKLTDLVYQYSNDDSYDDEADLFPNGYDEDASDEDYV